MSCWSSCRQAYIVMSSSYYYLCQHPRVDMSCWSSRRYVMCHVGVHYHDPPSKIFLNTPLLAGSRLEAKPIRLHANPADAFSILKEKKGSKCVCKTQGFVRLLTHAHTQVWWCDVVWWCGVCICVCVYVCVQHVQ